MKLMELKPELPMDKNSRIKRAMNMGFTVKAFHGTYSDFDTFKIGDLGYHFGSLDQAEARIDTSYAVGNDSDREGMNIMPVLLKMKNPLIMNDVYGWDEAEDVISGLLETKQFIQSANKQVIGELHSLLKEYDEDNSDEIMSSVREIIKSLGFDSIKYHNGVEGKKGNTSYLVFDSSQVRSIFGKFDPTKAASPNISENRK